MLSAETSAFADKTFNFFYMKKLLLLISLLSASFSLLFSHDTIFTTNNDTLLCKIMQQDGDQFYVTLYRENNSQELFLKKSEVRSISFEQKEQNQQASNHSGFASTFMPASGKNTNFDSYIPSIDRLSIGFGAGLDYGGLIGINFLAYPQENIGLFGGAGFALTSIGYNAGLKLRASLKSTVHPYATGMYGYNAVINVTNASRLNKMFYGPTIGGGIDLKSKKRDNLYWTFAVLFPIRSAEVDDYIHDLKTHYRIEFKNELLPFALSFGFRYAIK